jgi:hypothetical protein
VPCDTTVKNSACTSSSAMTCNTSVVNAMKSFPGNSQIATDHSNNTGDGVCTPVSPTASITRWGTSESLPKFSAKDKDLLVQGRIIEEWDTCCRMCIPNLGKWGHERQNAVP